MLSMTKTRPVFSQRTKKHNFVSMDIFKTLPSFAMRDIENKMIVKKFSKRESIFLESDQADFVWFVKEGYVKEVNHSPDGKANTLCMVGPNGMFGISAFNGGEYGFHCVAETDTTVISFPIHIFQALMEKFPEVAKVAFSKISKLLRQSKDMQTFSQESAEKRILHVLLEMVEVFGNIIPLTRKEIAEMAGTAVETCIRSCIRLEKAGLMTTAHAHITVKNAGSLMDRMEEF